MNMNIYISQNGTNSGFSQRSALVNIFCEDFVCTGCCAKAGGATRIQLAACRYTCQQPRHEGKQARVHETWCVKGPFF